MSNAHRCKCTFDTPQKCLTVKNVWLSRLSDLRSIPMLLPTWSWVGLEPGTSKSLAKRTNLWAIKTLQSKIQVYTKYSLLAQHLRASYMIGSGTTMQRNHLAPQIAARHTISFFIYVMNWKSAGGNWSQGLSPGRRDSHYNTDQQKVIIHIK